MTNREYAQCLRRIAVVYEDNPDIKQPYEGVDSPWWIFTWNAEDFARTVLAFGKGNKRFGNDELLFIPDVGLQLQMRCQRDQVCDRKVVGTRHVPEKVIPAQVIPAHEEDIVEWDCKPILAKRTAPPLVELAAELPEPDIPF